MARFTADGRVRPQMGRPDLEQQAADEENDPHANDTDEKAARMLQAMGKRIR